MERLGRVKIACVYENDSEDLINVDEENEVIFKVYRYIKDDVTYIRYTSENLENEITFDLTQSKALDLIILVSINEGNLEAYLHPFESLATYLEQYGVKEKLGYNDLLNYMNINGVTNITLDNGHLAVITKRGIISGKMYNDYLEVKDTYSDIEKSVENISLPVFLKRLSEGYWYRARNISKGHRVPSYRVIRSTSIYGLHKLLIEAIEKDEKLSITMSNDSGFDKYDEIYGYESEEQKSSYKSIYDLNPVINYTALFHALKKVKIFSITVFGDTLTVNTDKGAIVGKMFENKFITTYSCVKFKACIEIHDLGEFIKSMAYVYSRDVKGFKEVHSVLYANIIRTRYVMFLHKEVFIKSFQQAFNNNRIATFSMTVDHQSNQSMRR